LPHLNSVFRRPSSLLVGTAVLAAALLVAACSGDRSGGPRGAPEVVVGDAPQHTIAARTASVIVNGTDMSATGVVDLTTGTSRLDISDGSTVVRSGSDVWIKGKGEAAFSRIDPADLPASLRPVDPAAAVDLLGGAVHILSDGGAEVRGASTLAYTLGIDPARAASGLPAGRAAAVQRLTDDAGGGELQVQVAIDSLGRVRRVLLPVPLRSGPPTTRVDGEPVAVTIDFASFGAPAPVAVPPT
jgi:hypothetical protein